MSFWSYSERSMTLLAQVWSYLNDHDGKFMAGGLGSRMSLGLNCHPLDMLTIAEQHELAVRHIYWTLVPLNNLPASHWKTVYEKQKISLPLARP